MATTTQERTIQWRDSLDAALSESGKNHKPVLLDFFSPT